MNTQKHLEQKKKKKKTKTMLEVKTLVRKPSLTQGELCANIQSFNSWFEVEDLIERDKGVGQASKPASVLSNKGKVDLLNGQKQ